MTPHIYTLGNIFNGECVRSKSVRSKSYVENIKYRFGLLCVCFVIRGTNLDLDGILGHVEELRNRVMKIIITVAAIGIFTFIFGLRAASIGGIPIYYPFPDVYNNINTIIFNHIRADFLGGTGVSLIQVGLADAMMIQAEISLFVGIAIGMPVIVYQINKFLAPALKEKEKQMLVTIALPATFLFILGCAFAYFLIIPFTFKFLYGYTFAMGVLPTLSIESFVTFVLVFEIAFGIVFEMPVIQYGLTKLKVVKAEFWIKNWRYAFVGMIIFGGVITPDGSGITQLMIAFPMLGLYFIGYMVSRYVDKKDTPKKET